MVSFFRKYLLGNRIYLTPFNFCQTQNFKKFLWRRLRPKLVGKLLFLLALYPLIHVLFYINVIRWCSTQSIGYFLQCYQETGETPTQRSTKRLREDTETLTSEILLSNSSTSTIIQEEGYQFKPFNSSTTTEPWYRWTCNKTVSFKRKIGKIQLTDFLSKWARNHTWTNHKKFWLRLCR